mgnify:FL=1
MSKDCYSRCMKKPFARLSLIWVLLLSGSVLLGCQTAQVSTDARMATEDQTADPSVEQLPELNLPEPLLEASCDCSDVEIVSEETYFDRAMRALAARDFEQASLYFTRHAAATDSVESREADVGLALIALLSSNPSMTDDSQALDDRAEVLALALSLVRQLENRVSVLEKRNVKLASDLEKREAVLKRLRELTLGQLED